MKLDRIRCAICERTKGEDENPTMHRIAPCMLSFVFFLCGDCLRLPPEDRLLKDLIKERQQWKPGS